LAVWSALRSLLLWEHWTGGASTTTHGEQISYVCHNVLHAVLHNTGVLLPGVILS
jgi:hypothetical protein